MNRAATILGVVSESWRVVLVDLGRRSYGRAELLRGGRPIATREDVEYDYATEDCLERAGDDWLKTKKCL